MRERSEKDAVLLFRGLWQELFQTETSASVHCRREASRLEGAPPAHALVAVARHADSVLPALRKLTEQYDLPHGRAGSATGQLFSSVRERLTDTLMRSERSYRATLLGTRHGLDVMRMAMHAANQLGHSEIARAFDEWLRTRAELVRDLEVQLAWFARHPEKANRVARPLLLVGREHAS